MKLSKRFGLVAQVDRNSSSSSSSSAGANQLALGLVARGLVGWLAYWPVGLLAGGWGVSTRAVGRVA